MTQNTKIEWADSTCNPEMGCDGCELWNPAAGVKICYAGVLTERYTSGPTPNKGFPEAFDKPKIFPGRIEAACRWKDLTGTKRADKSWLDGYPRLIFLDDMGDTFTESLPLDWLLPYIPAMEASPHIWQFLTKRPYRMLKFFEQLGRVPANFWLGCSLIERKAFRSRMDAMRRLQKAFPFARLFGSWEPMIEPLPWTDDDICTFSWLILGGESGTNVRPCDIEWIRDAIGFCRRADTKAFVKQLGSHVVTSGCSSPGQHWPAGVKRTDKYNGNFRAHLVDKKGGSPAEWPEDLRVREMP